MQNNENWDRIYAIIRRTGMSSNAFARYIGLPCGENLYRIKRGCNGISRDVADRIVKKFPEVSKAWILTGEGCMYTRDNDDAGYIPFFGGEPLDVVRNYLNLQPEQFIHLPQVRECDFAMEYPSTAFIEKSAMRTILMLKKIDKKDIIEGKEYLFVYKNCLTLRKWRRAGAERESAESMHDESPSRTAAANAETADMVFAVIAKTIVNI